MHGGAIFGFQSLIERIPQHEELIVLLDNTDSPKLMDIARKSGEYCRTCIERFAPQTQTPSISSAELPANRFRTIHCFFMGG